VVEPLLKWAGGKRWLTSGDKLPLPDSYERYVEPFLGSGAVFFYLEPEKSVISDRNPDLISFYEVVRDSPDDLHKLMRVHHEKHSRDYYYEIRSVRSVCKIERAAAFLYLNRTCWNGLYRVNREGIFNVPIGTKKNVLMATDDFLRVSEVLKRAELLHCDFEDTLNRCGRGDFVFVDPPYTVKHNNNGFVKYNEEIFSWQDQLRLSTVVGRAAERGAAIVVTNADHSSVHELYGDAFVYRSLSRHSVLSASSASRRSTTEAVFTANL